MYYEDPELVAVEDKIGVVRISTNTIFGTTNVEYRPNGFTDADFVMKENRLW
ncbi:hypothetical protein D3C85_1705360 [compost metagenome]